MCNMGIEYAIQDYGLAVGIIVACSTIITIMVRAFIKYLEDERGARQKQVEAYMTLAENHISHNTEAMNSMITAIREIGRDNCRDHDEIKSKLNDLKK